MTTHARAAFSAATSGSPAQAILAANPPPAPKPKDTPKPDVDGTPTPQPVKPVAPPPPPVAKPAVSGPAANPAPVPATAPIAPPAPAADQPAAAPTPSTSLTATVDTTDPAPFASGGVASAAEAAVRVLPIEQLGALTGLSFGPGLALWPVLLTADVVAIAALVRMVLRRRRTTDEA